jgi:hypothetical protein
MTTMAATVALALMVALMVALHHVMTVNLIGLHTDLSAVIQRGMSLV